MVAIFYFVNHDFFIFESLYKFFNIIIINEFGMFSMQYLFNFVSMKKLYSKRKNNLRNINVLERKKCIRLLYSKIELKPIRFIFNYSTRFI